jgi:hypothetical protein
MMRNWLMCLSTLSSKNPGARSLLGADLTLGDEPGEGDRVVLAIFFEPHGLQISKLKPSAERDGTDGHFCQQCLDAPPRAAERRARDAAFARQCPV